MGTPERWVILATDPGGPRVGFIGWGGDFVDRLERARAFDSRRGAEEEIRRMRVQGVRCGPSGVFRKCTLTPAPRDSPAIPALPWGEEPASPRPA